jgi:hypothetical protein
VARHFHFAPGLGDTAIVVDEKGRALDAEIFAAVRAFFLPRSIALDGASASMSTRRVASASCVRRPAATARTRRCSRIVSVVTDGSRSSALVSRSTRAKARSAATASPVVCEIGRQWLAEFP